MPAGKSYKCLLLLILFKSALSYGQSLKGTYRLENRDDIFLERDVTITFNRGVFNTYRDQSINDVIGFGEYTITNKALTLKYLKVPNQDSSAFSIIARPKNSENGHVDLTAYYPDKMEHATSTAVRLENRDGKLIKLFKDHESASFDLQTTYEGQNLDHITILLFPYYSVIIPAVQLLGKDSKIIIQYKDALHYYLPPSTTTYKILKKRKDEIDLLDDKKVKFTLRKVAAQ